MKNAGVLLLAPYPDIYIQALEPFFHRIFLVDYVQADKVVKKKRTKSKQMSLEV